MKSTICTEAGRIVIEASAGRVTSNGVTVLPHEAFLIACELQRAAESAVQQARKVCDAAQSNPLVDAAGG